MRRSARGDAVTLLIFELFRLNGRLLTAGDRLGADLGLSSARWQVLGAIKHGAFTVSQIARTIGLTRQAVQRVVNDLAGRRLVGFEENPGHRRAKLVQMTAAGRAVMKEMDRRQAAWSDWLADVVAIPKIKTTSRVLADLRVRLESREPGGEKNDR